MYLCTLKSYTHAMRARKTKKNCWTLLLMTLSFLTLSCSKDNNTATYNDYCYIKSVTLGNVKRKIEKRDRLGNLITTTNTSFSGSAFAMTINHRNNTIENRDSLPYGSQLSALLATISFDGSMIKYREKGSNSEWTLYNSVDSLNLTKPLELLLTANDNNSNRTYILKVNVHQQEGDSLYWKMCENGIAPLAGIIDMKAFIWGDKLMALGEKVSGIVLAERNGLEAQGTWEETATTGLPLTADLQTLRQHAGTLYLSTGDGNIFSSSDAKTWQQVGAPHSAALTLIEKTDDYFYAISESKLLRSADAIDWSHEEKLDTKADSLPAYDIRALTIGQANGNIRIVMVGQNDDHANAVVWNKMWNQSELEKNAEWMYFPFSSDNKIPCPRLRYLNLLAYDGKCVAFGGASMDGAHKALDAMYFSQDYGITWRPNDELHLPAQLEGIEGCITSTVDKNNFIWIITNAQVWRGRLNRLGFVQQ